VQKEPRHKTGRAPEEEGLYDESVSMARWSRLATGLLLIAAAIILLLVESHVGIVATPTHGGRAPAATPSIPGMATPVTIGSVTVELKFIGRQDSIGAMSASTGERFLLVATRVTNHGHRAIAVIPADFKIKLGDTVVASGRPYPGQPTGLRNLALQPGATAEGVLVFVVPDTAVGMTMMFAPSGAITTPARWQVP
jgi:hypothetical protein